MSVDCAVMFNDPERTVITMTVWDWSPEGYDLARVLNLAVAAYESRMKRPAPLIEGSGSKYLDGIVDILGIQDRNILTGKTGSVLQQGEYRRTMMWAQALFGFRKRDGDASPAQPDGKRGRQRPRSTAEWEELKRGRDLRRLARADPALRRELLNTFDTCPCCNRSLDHKPEDKVPDIVPLTAEEFAASGLADLGLSREHVAWADPTDLKEVACITSAEDLFDFLAERIIQRLPADKQNQARADWWKARDQRGGASVHETHDDK